MKKTFGDRLSELRQENNLTIEEFIRYLKEKFPDISLDKSTVSKYENNIHTPKRFTIVEAIADFFGVSISYLMGRSDNRYGDDVDGTKKIPILGTIAAGIPIMAQEDILGYEVVPQNFHANFCLKVKGDSMVGARILDGDIVYVRQQPQVENGEIAAVIIDGQDATLKRFYKTHGKVTLRAENPNYSDIVFTTKDMKDVKILGKAVFFKSEVR